MAKLAIVTPWYGKQLTGGAERQARQLAERFAARGHEVTVLTTTVRSPSGDWSSNDFSVGMRTEDGVVVRRFRVEPRDRDAFDRANAFFLSQPVGQGRPLLPQAHVEAFLEQNINSRALLEHLREHGTDYRALIFLPYLYGPTLRGLPIVAERAWLQPCLHHEIYAFIPEVAAIFRRAKGVLFNSDGESELALRLYGPGIRDKGYVVGEWIDEPLRTQLSGGRIGQFAAARERYILYLGRRDETKNVGLLIESFLMYRRQNYATTMKLVLAGAGNTSYQDETQGVIDLGVVTESQRDALIDHCLALFQPSYNESFSRVVMEAWSRGRAVAVNAQCISTAQAVRRSDGGWLATTKSEWADVMRILDALTGEQLAALGRRGNEYYRGTATAQRVMELYETALRLNADPTERTSLVYQLVPSLDLCEDAVRRALTVDASLRAAGYATMLETPHRRGPIPGGAILAVYSSADEDLERAREFEGDVVLFYDRASFALADHGVRALAPILRLAYVSDDAAAEFVRDAGAPQVEILPFAVGMSCWDVEPDRDLLAEFEDGRVNCLFAGRLEEQSCCEQLLAAFAYLLSLEVDARLIIVGVLEPDVRYHAQLLRLITDHHLLGSVRFISASEPAAVAAAYRAATLFWSMSEGRRSQSAFVDAMWFDVPILAFAAEHITPLLDRGGILFNSKDDLLRIAALAKVLIVDHELRSRVISAQDERRTAFIPAPAQFARLQERFGRVPAPAG